MQKLLTISALIIMLLLQYSRQAAYLHCKVEAINTAASCDCEKIMYHADADDHENEPKDVLKPIAPDDLFVSVELFSFGNSSGPLHKPSFSSQHFFSQLFIPCILQPPIC